jgi:hypothetical protein
MQEDNMKYITARAKVFGSFAEYKFQIDDYGNIRVWDDVGGHFSTCNDLQRHDRGAKASHPKTR